MGKDKDYNDIIGRDSVDVTVVVTGREPKITLPQNVYDIRCGDTNSFTFTADGRPGPDISVTSSNAPPVSFSFDGGRACYTNEYVGNFTFEPTVPNDYDFLFTVSNSVGVVSTNVTVRVPSVASALGFDSTEVTADEIVCQVKSFGISDNCVTGTVELVAEEGGTVVQESTKCSAATRLATWRRFPRNAMRRSRRVRRRSVSAWQVLSPTVFSRCRLTPGGECDENGGKQNGEKSGAAITFFVTVMFLD